MKFTTSDKLLVFVLPLIVGGLFTYFVRAEAGIVAGLFSCAALYLGTKDGLRDKHK